MTGLPPDATEMEVAQLFTKCGVIKLDEEQRPRVKVYRCAPRPANATMAGSAS